MKATITVTFDIETTEYNGCRPIDKSVKKLIEAMFSREADLPDKMDVKVKFN